jgi:hypothetical protein
LQVGLSDCVAIENFQIALQALNRIKKYNLFRVPKLDFSHLFTYTNVNYGTFLQSVAARLTCLPAAYF